MAPVDIAIKELFKEELHVVQENQTKHDDRFTKIEQAFEELSGRVEERAREAQLLRDDVERHRQDHESLDARVKILESFDSEALRGRVQRLESDEDGAGGLQQLRERLDGVGRELREVQPRVEENSRIVGATKSRTDELDGLVKQSGRDVERLHETVQASEERLQNMEVSASAVKLAQQAIEDVVARKYETLWNDVLHAIEEAKASQLEQQRKELEQRREDTKLEAKNIVSYALNLLGSAHAERRRLALAKDLVVAWREQTWICARRRIGLWRLQTIWRRRNRVALNRWCRRTAELRVEADLRAEYTSLLPDVGKAIESSGLPTRCSELEAQISDGLEAVRKAQVDDYLSKEDFEVKVEERNLVRDTSLQERLDKLQREGNEAIQDLEKSVANMTKLSQENVDKATDNFQKALEEAKQATEEFARRLDEQEQHTLELDNLLDDCAKTKELQTMTRDTLLMWNSIKQLDLAKLDRQALDSIADAAAERERIANRRAEEMEAQIKGTVQEGVLQMQGRCQEIDGKVDESSKQVQHWEQMWEKLANYVEDLVAKMSEVQAVAEAATPSNKKKTGGGSGTLRPPLRRSRSRERDKLQRSRTDAELSSGVEGADVTVAGVAYPPSQRGLASSSADTDAHLPWMGGSARSSPTNATTERPGIRAQSKTRPRSATSQRGLDRAGI
eukprot:TRINITY_DN49053_c0_g1_i1.p1 TRINITY_DN49053_c0_g1~~TRINITY_DN49053_c0_g1_i1.p1  ORF type:complete len:709 (+),score=144.70 TRINITY_DN49053_c0_g1_i1:95-2128(+)